MRRTLLRLIIIGALLLIAFDTIVSNASVDHAYGKNHDRDLEYVLFGKTGKMSGDRRDAIEALEAAAYLAIDQFGADNENHYKTENCLTLLKQYGVNNLPSAEKINISATETSHHREYTHKGWDSKYRNIKDYTQTVNEEWSQVWKIRKSILENTVNEMFDFNPYAKYWLIGPLFSDFGQKCDSFCALVYYIHILGDHVSTKTIPQYEYLLPVGGKLNGNDIIHEVLYHCEVLFPEQLNSNSYYSFEIKMNAVANQYYLLGTIRTQGQLLINQEYAGAVLDIMQKYIPNFLETAPFFENTFGLKEAS